MASITLNVDTVTAQVATLSAPLGLNLLYVSLPCSATSAAITAGTPLQLRSALTGNNIQMTASQSVAQGATSIPVDPFVANAIYGPGDTISQPNPTTVDILPILKAQLGVARTDKQRDDDLAMLAEIAMEKYTELKPLTLRSSFMSQQGQLTYALPSHCRLVTDVAVPSQYGYYNDWLFLPMIDTPASSLFGYSDYAFRSPSERIVREELLSELDHYAQTFAAYYVEYQPQATLYILPVSVGSGIPISVRYFADHINQNPVDPLNPVWNTLPAGHWKHVIRLVKWAVADKLADLVMSPLALSANDAGAGGLSESYRLSNRADRLLAEVRMALGVDATAVLRS